VPRRKNNFSSFLLGSGFPILPGSGVLFSKSKKQRSQRPVVEIYHVSADGVWERIFADLRPIRLPLRRRPLRVR
jgi:hypothetical protein